MARLKALTRAILALFPGSSSSSATALTSCCSLATICAAVPISEVAAFPSRLRRDGSLEGPYQGDSGFVSRKQQLVSYGADSFDISVALLEHGDALAADPSQNGANDQNIGVKGEPGNYDGANFGLFNNNWYMIRTYCEGFTGLTMQDWKQGAALNDDPKRAVACQKATRAGFGGSWQGVQRSGQSQCNKASIQAYTSALATIQPYNQAHMNDSMWESYNVVYQGSC